MSFLKHLFSNWFTPSSKTEAPSYTFDKFCAHAILGGLLSFFPLPWWLIGLTYFLLKEVFWDGLKGGVTDAIMDTLAVSLGVFIPYLVALPIAAGALVHSYLRYRKLHG